MIIKSMGRKDKSFLQLFDYLNKEELKGYDNFILHNLYSNERIYIVNAFYKNSNYLSHRKNCNFLYHEVITLRQNIKEVSIEKQKSILKDLGQKYLSQRAKYNLAYGVIHQEKQHIHLHLMISANELESKKRHFLKKKVFNQIEKDLESYCISQYPELKEKALLNKAKGNIKTRDYKNSKNKSKDKEIKCKQRTKTPSKKELFKHKLQELFNKSLSKEAFIKNLEQENISCYIRGKAIGFIDLSSNKKYRLKTLELEREFEAMNKKIEQHLKRQKDYSKDSKLEQRIKELQEITSNKEQNKDYNL